MGNNYEKYIDDVVDSLPSPMNYADDVYNLGVKLVDIGKKLGDLFKFKTRLPDAPKGHSYKGFQDRRNPSKNGGLGEVVQANQVLYDTTTGFPVSRWSYSRQSLDPLYGIDHSGAFIFSKPDRGKSYMAGRKQLLFAGPGVPNHNKGYSTGRMAASRSVAARMVIAGKIPVNPTFKARILGTGGERSRGGQGQQPGHTQRGRGEAAPIGKKLAVGVGIAAALAKGAGLW